MKILHAIAMGAAPLLATSVALAQNSNMMSGAPWGDAWMSGYGGIWTPILLVIVVVGLVAWVAKRK